MKTPEFVLPATVIYELYTEFHIEKNNTIPSEWEIVKIEPLGSNGRAMSIEYYFDIFIKPAGEPEDTDNVYCGYLSADNCPLAEHEQENYFENGFCDRDNDVISFYKAKKEVKVNYVDDNSEKRSTGTLFDKNDISYILTRKTVLQIEEGKHPIFEKASHLAINDELYVIKHKSGNSYYGAKRNENLLHESFDEESYEYFKFFKLKEKVILTI